MKEDELRKLAQLARLRLRDDELQHLGPQLARILEFIQQLSELDTDEVQPMTTALEVVNRWQADQHRPGLSSDQALANAPHSDGSFFLVPPVIGPTS